MSDFTFQDGDKQPPGVTKDVQQQRVFSIRATKTESGATIPPSITRETPVLAEWDINARFSEAFKYEIFENTNVASLSIMFKTPPIGTVQKLIKIKKIKANADIPIILSFFENVTYGAGGTNKSVICNDRNNPFPLCDSVIFSQNDQAGFITLNATHTGGTELTNLGIVDGPLLAYEIIEEFPFYLKPETLYQIIAQRAGTTSGKMGLGFWWAQVPAGK